MTTYCPNGHRVSYSGVKPAKCPTCGTSTNPPPVVVIPPAAQTPNRSSQSAPASRPPQSWGQAADQIYPQDDDLAFDNTIRVDIPENGTMTIEELQKSKEPIERGESRAAVSAASLKGVERISARDLVGEIVADAMANPPPPPPPAPKRRRARKAKGGGA